MLVADYLRGRRRRPGWWLRRVPLALTLFPRTLASVLVMVKVDVMTVQEILRHQNLETTLEIYARSMSDDRLAAQGM